MPATPMTSTASEYRNVDLMASLDSVEAEGCATRDSLLDHVAALYRPRNPLRRGNPAVVEIRRVVRVIPERVCGVEKCTVSCITLLAGLTRCGAVTIPTAAVSIELKAAA